MTVLPADATFLPKGAHKSVSVCLALVGDRRVSTRWAVRAMQIQYPVHCERSLFCFPHPNLDVSRNFSLAEATRHYGGTRDWVALVAAESMIRWDAIIACLIDGALASKIGESYVLHRSVIEKHSAPWFIDGKWQGEAPKERPDLIQPQEEVWRAAHVGATPDPSPAYTSVTAKKMLAICVPTLGHTSLAWVAHALQLVPVLASTGSLVVAEGHEVADARNQIVEAVLGMDPTPEWMLFWGDDNLPPTNGLQLLYETASSRGASAVAGLYFMKQSPPDTPLMWRNDLAGPMYPGQHWQLGEVVEVDGTGLDFVLFRTEALRSVERPRFRTVMDWLPGQGLIMQTEDAYFWPRWKQAHGVGPLVDTRCRVGHYAAADGTVYGLDLDRAI